ncbi:MAG: hypothetical protein PHU64_03420 [Candidatus Omnitrophica bacterium]|nr:hypothetical protein [Candidatus Omnitrophota bacterium]MDD5430016.1 hypothetical protein [Candidatus Omnitrophota bacterium]
MIKKLKIFFTKLFSSDSVQEQNENKVKVVIEEIISQLKLKRKISNIVYRKKHDWYIVSFFSPPNCIIPRHYIEDYLKTGGNLGKKEISEILSFENKGFNLI